MENFIYKNPTEIIFGRNRLHALKDQLLKRGYRSALVLYGGSHGKENGTLEQITTQLESCSISYFVQGGDTSQSKAVRGRANCQKRKG